MMNYAEMIQERTDVKAHAKVLAKKAEKAGLYVAGGACQAAAIGAWAIVLKERFIVFGSDLAVEACKQGASKCWAKAEKM